MTGCRHVKSHVVAAAKTEMHANEDVTSAPVAWVNHVWIVDDVSILVIHIAVVLSKAFANCAEIVTFLDSVVNGPLCLYQREHAQQNSRSKSKGHWQV